MAALLFPWAISPRISRSRGVSRSIGELALVAREATSCSTLGVDDRSAGRHGTHCIDEIVGVGDTILEQIGAAVRTGFEKCQGVRRSGELAEHDDTDRGGGSPASERRRGFPRQCQLVACGCR